MDFLNLAQNLGVAVACLVALGLAVWRALVFIGINILKPLTERHIAFLDRLQEVIEKQTQVVDRLVSDHKSITDQLDGVVAKLDQIVNEVGEVKELILDAEKPLIKQTRPS